MSDILIKLKTEVNAYFVGSGVAVPQPRFVEKLAELSGVSLLRTCAKGRDEMLAAHPDLTKSSKPAWPLWVRADFSFQVVSTGKEVPDLGVKFCLSASSERIGRKFSVGDKCRMSVKITQGLISERAHSYDVPISGVLEVLSSDQASALTSPEFVQGLKGLIPIPAKATRQRYDIALNAMRANLR